MHPSGGGTVPSYRMSSPPGCQADQLKLYTLIWQRTLASQMADATGSTATVKISAPAGGHGEALFQASGTVIDFPGFMKATGEQHHTAKQSGRKGENAEGNASLPPMSAGQRLDVADVQADGHETQPPARYTEASLVKTLEAKEIGRPSTYASIISTIIDRGYVYERGRALIPSWLAFAVVKLLETKFPKLVDYQFTADMENGLDQIAHGKQTGRDWLTRFYFGDGDAAAANADEAHEGLQRQVAQLGEIDARAINTIEIGDGLHVRVGRYGPYLEDMAHTDEDGNPKRAALPDTIAPDELTVDVARDLTRESFRWAARAWQVIRRPEAPWRCVMAGSAHMWHCCQSKVPFRRPRPRGRRSLMRLARKWPACLRR